MRRALLCWVAFMVAAALLKLAGFMLSFALLTYFIVAVMYRRGALRAAVVAVALVAAFYVVFPFALGVALP